MAARIGMAILVAGLSGAGQLNSGNEVAGRAEFATPAAETAPGSARSTAR